MGFGSNLKALRVGKEWSQAKLAKESGVSQQLISQIERDVNESTKELPALARALGAKPSDIDPAYGDTPASPSVRPADVALPAIGSLPRDVPVLGTAAGSDYERGAFQLSTDAVDYVRRPPSMLSNTAIYALYVEGESMVPKYEPGELIYVNPLRPVRPGDYVVIQELVGDDETRRGFVKLYVRRAGDWHVVRQFNPEGEMRFAAKGEATRVHRVLSTTDLLGI